MIRANVEYAAPSGVIFDIKRYAIHDGPGIRTTVFLKGCSLHCRWCHNPESWRLTPEHSLRAGKCQACGTCVSTCERHAISLSDHRPVVDQARCVLCGDCVQACPTGAREIIGYRIGVAEVIADIERDVIFYDESGGGVTFSGGEPLMQADFLCALLSECETREIHTAVDTSCYAEPQVVERVGQHTDLFLCDLKHMNSEAHEQGTGVGNELILENIRRLALAGRNIVLRFPVVPGYNDDEPNIEATGRFAASLGGVSGIDVLPYNRGGAEKSARLAEGQRLMDSTAPPDGRLKEITERLRSFGLVVRTGG